MPIVQANPSNQADPSPKVAVIIPLCNAAKWLPEFLPALQSQSPFPAEVLFIDSTSDDDTLNILHDAGFQAHGIKRADFNHGGTRGLATLLVDADIYVYLTQDAVLDSADAIASLIAPFDEDKSIGVTYGRQLPRHLAKPLESHARQFNYSALTETRSLADADRFGIKTCFCSDSFAAYRREALDAIGGFPACVIGTEDTYVTGRMLLAGWKVRYVAEARVRHSHDYSLPQQFCRYFDIGAFYGRERWIDEHYGKARGEGMRFALSEARYLVKNQQWLLIPYAFLHNAAKALGYKLGKLAYQLPRWLVKRISMNSNFWNQLRD